jgi:ABC-type transport system involved in cytochrome bd biosynthesis fused ATPase/permease subunit
LPSRSLKSRSCRQTAVPEQVALTLEDVTFSYASRRRTRWKISVSAGAADCILGRTGCGKSTLLQLLTRAWDPQHGQILLTYAATDFSEQALRKTVSVVRSACICLAPRCAITCCWLRQRPLMMRSRHAGTGRAA